MLKTALDLVPILEAIDVIKNSKLLTKEQQNTVLREMVQSLPPAAFCKQCPETLSIINKLVETTDGSQAKRTPKEETSKAKEEPKHGETAIKEPIRKAASDTRRQGKVSGNAKEPKEQGRQTTKRSRRLQ